jgi:hypothetical protein
MLDFVNIDGAPPPFRLSGPVLSQKEKEPRKGSEGSEDRKNKPIKLR